MDFADDITGQDAELSAESPSVDQAVKIPESDKKLVAEITTKIKADKRHHAKAFRRMRRDMHVAMHGAEETWGEENYKANVLGRHVKMKTAALYAKNPKSTAKRRETLDFALWDEDPTSLQLAMQTVQQATLMAQQSATMPPQIDEFGQVVPAPMPPGFEEAQALLTDFQQGSERRQMIKKFGKTLEILFGYTLDEQKPLDFKRGMKQVVRRTTTAGVGYVELGFQRETGPRPGMTEKLADFRQRLDHLQNLSQKLADEEISETDAEMAELTHSIESLQAEPEIVLREGLIVDYPAATKVIPDTACKNLEGFLGSGHLTIEYSYTVDEVKEVFGVDLGNEYTRYSLGAGSQRAMGPNDVMDDDYEWSSPEKKKDGLVCVWKHYDKPTGLVYFLADGHTGFLRPPAAPDVFVEGFWPVYALVFNASENENELFPLSDVSLLLDMQREYNRSRQGKREHRQAARPRWVYANGAIDEEDASALQKLRPFQALGLNMEPTVAISDILQSVPVPGVDPNLYDTGEIFSDMQIVGGAQEAQYGATSDSTATESALAANSTSSSDGSSIDDLDSFLTVLARDGGQILMREMSEEKVREIVGPGAVWPEMSLSDIMKEVNLEVEAGSTGKPNQAVEIRNWQQLLPYLIQMGGIDPTWLARETLRRLDDRMDLTDAIIAGIPSIMAMNSQQGKPAAADASDPNQQGAEGANNAEKPPGGEGGSDPAMGTNRGPAGVIQYRADGTRVAA